MQSSVAKAQTSNVGSFWLLFVLPLYVGSFAEVCVWTTAAAANLAVVVVAGAAA